jgi:hypothetical protein
MDHPMTNLFVINTKGLGSAFGFLDADLYLQNSSDGKVRDDLTFISKNLRTI